MNSSTKTRYEPYRELPASSSIVHFQIDFWPIMEPAYEEPQSNQMTGQMMQYAGIHAQGIQ